MEVEFGQLGARDARQSLNFRRPNGERASVVPLRARFELLGELRNLGSGAGKPEVQRGVAAEKLDGQNADGGGLVGRLVREIFALVCYKFQKLLGGVLDCLHLAAGSHAAGEEDEEPPEESCRCLELHVELKGLDHLELEVDHLLLAAGVIPVLVVEQQDHLVERRR